MKSAIKQRVKRDKQQNGGERETGRRRGNHTPFGPAVAGLALTAAVHARDAMAAGALVNHPLPERNITPGRLLKIADGGWKDWASCKQKKEREKRKKEREKEKNAHSPLGPKS